MIRSHSAHIFLDANTALHFKRPDQIDWCSRVGTKYVVLVGAPILSRELEQQKVHNPSRKLRERASTYTKWLAPFVRDSAVEVRAGTIWHFIPVEPAIDFSTNNLSLSIADDHLIASVITYEAPDDAQVYVATADVGLEIKLRHRSIKPLLLSDELKLPEEADPYEKENRELRRQLAQRRTPALALAPETGGDRYQMKILPLVTVATAPSLIEVSEANPLLHTPSSPPATRGDYSLAGLLQIETALKDSIRNSILSPDRVASYNKQRDEFLAAYRDFLEELLAWEEHRALTVQVELSISNSGTAPATEIDVILRLPEDLILMTDDDLPEKPEQPAPPQRPDRVPAIWGPFRGESGFADNLRSAFIDPLGPSVEVDNHRHQANYWIKNLKHGFTEELEPMYLQFPDRKSVRRFHADYEISAAEIAEPVKAQLHFIL